MHGFEWLSLGYVKPKCAKAVSGRLAHNIRWGSHFLVQGQPGQTQTCRVGILRQTRERESARLTTVVLGGSVRVTWSVFLAPVSGQIRLRADTLEGSPPAGPQPLPMLAPQDTACTQQLHQDRRCEKSRGSSSDPGPRPSTIVRRTLTSRSVTDWGGAAGGHLVLLRTAASRAAHRAGRYCWPLAPRSFMTSAAQRLTLTSHQSVVVT